MIDATRFAHWMTAIADRTKSPLAPSTNALYYGILSAELTTEAFEAAALLVLNEYDDFGFPPPAIFIAKAKPAPVFDGAALSRQIEKLSMYNPNTGMIPPHVGKVREVLGDVVADAYATAGSDRLLSTDDTTRAIAQREFQQSLEKFAAVPGNRPLIASPVEARRISDRNAPAKSVGAVLDGVMKSLPNKPAA